MKKRIDYIDIAKGIGIILVIMCHTGYLGILSAYVDAFFMPLFFVTAGMVYRTPSNKKEYIKKKIKVLLLPYFAWNVFCILVTMFMGRKIGFDAILGVLYGRFAFLKSGVTTHTTYLLHYNNSHLWFLPCMFLLTVLYMLIDTSIRDIKKKNVVVVVLALLGETVRKLG